MLVGVVPAPHVLIGLLPFLAAHARVLDRDRLEVVLVEVGVHPDALLVQLLVVFRARQRRQHGEFEQVDRQLPLDDLDVALDRLRRVARQAHDEARIGDDAGLLPGLEHLSDIR